jgi:hypothetical protein
MLRLPALFLAALGLHAATRVALVAARASPSALLTGVASVSIALALVGLPVSLVPNDQRGLPEVVTTRPTSRHSPPSWNRSPCSSR